MKPKKRTRFLNFFRKALIHPLAEILLRAIVSGRPADHVISKLVPMPYLYRSPTWRVATRNGIKFRLDISDMVDWYVYYNFRDPGYDFLFRQIHPEDCVVDVGANIGYVTLRAAQLAYQGHVYGFEPSGYTYKKCRDNLRLNSFDNISIFNVGLGSNEGSLKLSNTNQANSGMNRIVTDVEESGAELVSVTTLDAWAERNQIEKIDIIKIDVEGFEMEILKGAAVCIHKFRPRLYIEINNSFLKRFGSSSSELHQWLENLGYWFFDISGTRIVNPEVLNSRQMDIFCRPRE